MSKSAQLSGRFHNPKVGGSISPPLPNSSPLRPSLKTSTGRLLQYFRQGMNKVESASLWLVAAIFSTDVARLLSFASSFCFICELSAFWTALSRAPIWSAGRAFDPISIHPARRRRLQPRGGRAAVGALGRHFEVAVTQGESQPKGRARGQFDRPSRKFDLSLSCLCPHVMLKIP